jgi:hypothetical protein
MPETTNLFDIPEWYLAWCWDNEAIQTHWRQEWQDEKGKLRSNIYPGDRFSIGKTTDIGVVHRKTFWPNVTVGGEDTYAYAIGGNIGGHYSSPVHKTLADGSYLWIPTIEQLLALKQHNTALDLFFYIANRADPDPLVKSYLTVAEKAGMADQDGDWHKKRIYAKEYVQYNDEMERCGISIDEADHPEEAMAKNGTEEFYFFHVRIDGKPWKMIDSRNGEWSEWQ